MKDININLIFDLFMVILTTGVIFVYCVIYIIFYCKKKFFYSNTGMKDNHVIYYNNNGATELIDNQGIFYY